MAGYIGSKAVNLSTTGADIAGDADVSGALDVGGAFTSQGIDDNATSTAMTLDASGNVGIGTTGSPARTLHVTRGDGTGTVVKIGNTGTSSATIEFSDTGTTDTVSIGSVGNDLTLKSDDGDISLNTTGDPATASLYVERGGNVGIGTSSPEASRRLTVDIGTTAVTSAVFKSSDTSGGSYVSFMDKDTTNSNRVRVGAINDSMSFISAGSEAMRINSSGILLHGKTTTSETVLGTKIELNSGGGRIIVTGNGGSGGALFLGNNTTGNVGLMRENGDFECVNNSYTGFSDVRLKENIENSGSQWEDIKALRVRKFSFIRDNVDAPDKIGVIAQELEGSGMSGLVSTNPDLSNPDETIKTVKYSILYMKAVKALQEAMERIETLEAEQTTIKARLDALETP